MINNISKFLEKFSKNILTDELYKKQIVEIIEKQTQLNISTSDVEIRNYTLYVKASPAVKNKIFIYKNKILEEISATLTTKVVDIR